MKSSLLVPHSFTRLNAFFIGVFLFHVAMSRGGDDFSRVPVDELAKTIINQKVPISKRRSAAMELLKGRLQNTNLVDSVMILNCFDWVGEDNREILRAGTGPWIWNFPASESIVEVAMRIRFAKEDSEIDVCYIAIQTDAIVTELDIKQIYGGKCPDKLRGAIIKGVVYQLPTKQK